MTNETLIPQGNQADCNTDQTKSPFQILEESGQYVQESSGITIDMSSKGNVCKGHCQNPDSDTIVCQKGEHCINFPRADDTVKRKYNREFNKILSNVY
ncbi:hypothetical protein CSB09_04195 [Candidatus Gracilibacteria bacterium]|nr:MAG: hypothetical protein CSB09_04195 [Candidatus Gracilibacteria bacterium]